MLDEAGSPATVASAGPRFFGFVIGGSLPVTVAANWLAGAWDQNAGAFVASPVAAKVEEVAQRWLLEVFGFPATTIAGFVSGATMANLTALAAARHRVLRDAGWDVEAQGLAGAPPVTVVVGDEVHTSVLKALGVLGLGRERVSPRAGRRSGAHEGGRPAGHLGPDDRLRAGRQREHRRLRPGGRDRRAGARRRRLGPRRRRLRPVGRRRSGACPSDALASKAPTPGRPTPTSGSTSPTTADSTFVRDPEPLRAAMGVTAAYLPDTMMREPAASTPELSRRARGVEVWAALRALGRSGLADLVERDCRHAARFAEGLRHAGHEILNDVVLNQVLVSFGDDDTTRRVVAAVQADGTCWAGGTVWQGRTAMRISVSSWATTADDVDRSLAAMIRVAGEVREARGPGG